MCYGSTIKMERTRAIKEYTDAILMCEGSECNRYRSIVSGLKSGKKKVDDEWHWLKE